MILREIFRPVQMTGKAGGNLLPANELLPATEGRLAGREDKNCQGVRYFLAR
jgi:hypothetical protein